MLELLLAVAAAYGAYRLWRSTRSRPQVATPLSNAMGQATLQRRRQQLARESARRQAAHKVKEHAHLMQVALLQLRQSPDFRRAATFAQQARNVPVTFRRRQFQRFRPLLVEHLAARLREGVSAENLLPGLTELVTALGVAAYEAEYIRGEAEGQRLQRTEARPSFAGRMRQLQAEHEQRLEAIRSLSALAPDLREQLLEAEQQRFRDQLLEAGDNAPNESPDRG